jgi:CheY-like chemotaxis protein
MSRLVDDDEGSRSLLRTLISQIEGLRIAREEKPQVVFLDLMMPDMSGFD